MTEKQPLKGTEFIESLNRFTTDLECINELNATVTPILQGKDKERKERAEALFEKYSKDDPDNPGKKIAEFPNEENKLFMETVSKFRRASTIFQNNNLISIIARYEEFLAEQIKIAFKTHPERLNKSDRTISYKEIFALSQGLTPSDLIIAKEVDELMRTSAEDQLKYIDKEFKTGLFDGFPELQHCIEACERRNSCAHTGGIISKQYIDKCNAIGYKWEKGNQPEVGSKAEVQNSYIKKVIGDFLILSIRITQGLIRRLLPDEKIQIDEHLNNAGLEFMTRGDFVTAKRLYLFALSIPDKHISGDVYKKIFLINKCLCMYHTGARKEMERELNSIDWSATHNRFRLAVQILHDKWSDAAALMRSSEVTEAFFVSWPLFKEFRKTSEFKTEFKNIFGKDFAFTPTITEAETLIPAQAG